MPDEQDTQEPSSPEYQALLEDLKAYDNPEAFQDSNLPQIYKFRVVNTLLSGMPDVFRLEVNGEILPDLLLESLMSLIRQDPEAESKMRELHGDKDLEEYRTHLLKDKLYQDAEREMFWFFVRHLPKFMMRFYEIIVVTSIFSGIRRTINEEPTESAKTEQLVRSALNRLLKTLENDIKRMLATRPKGRPRKSTNIDGRAPEVARQVWGVALGMMGDARGMEAVPGLKEIANELGTSDNALSKQLTRVKWSWTRIKNDLANLP